MFTTAVDYDSESESCNYISTSFALLLAYWLID